MKKVILSALTIYSCQTFATDAESPFYIGASLLNSETSYLHDKNSDIGYALRAGYAFSEYLSVEMAYQDLGTFTWSNSQFEGGGSFNSDAYSMSTVATYPINDFSLHLELGYQWVKRKGDIYSVVGNTPPYSFKDSSLMAGVGASYQLAKNIDVNLTYTKSSLYSWTSLGFKVGF
ncbi:porin family protein [Aliiglaciecola litoralis]|uniref:Outer membrane protein beta-barrel domain-containing protein n=1 Tax=Aliiglaciecola litoralis TaxID=582857 RepID=A0ABP3WSH0_9ALTE